MRQTISYLTLPAAVLSLALSQTGCEPVTPDSNAAATPAAARTVEPELARVPDLVIPAGTQLRVRLDHSLSTSSSRPGDRFSGSLVETVFAGGRIALPLGIGVSGVVRQSAPSDRLKGRAILAVAVDRVDLDGRAYQLSTAPVVRASGAHKKRNWAMIGGGTGVGALIGGLAGGGSAALMGAGAGAAAGTIGAAATGRLQVGLSAESVLTFKLSQPLAVRAPARILAP